jgi:hypothetical protein
LPFRQACVLSALVVIGGCGRLGFDFLPAPESHTAGDRDGAGDGDGDGDGDAGGDGDGDGDLDGGMNLDAGGDGDGDGDGDAGPGGDGDGGTVHIAALPYTASDAIWNDVIAGAPSVAILVLNPNSGVGTSFSQAFLDRTEAAQAAGIKVLGYVDTNYAARASSDVESEIDQYFSWYEVDGIYLDRTSSSCFDASYYGSLRAYVQSTYIDPSLLVVQDPGNNVPECYAPTASILVTFQGSYADYLSYTPDSWTANYPADQFWHLVYDASSIAQLTNAFALAAQRRAGYVFVTDDQLPNPWDALPGDTYWNTELDLAAP